MAGFLTQDGRYVSDPNALQRLFTRAEMEDTHPNFAETLATTGARPVWFGLTRSEVAVSAFSSLADTSNWRSFLEGAASYPADVGWCGYGIAAASGLIGDSAQTRVTFTGRRVWEVAEESHNTAMQGAEGINKLAFTASVYVNYLATGGAYGTAGRMAGGFFTQQVLAFFLARGFIPAQVAIAESPWFTYPMFAIVTAGSVVRLGEKYHDHATKSINDLQLTDLIIAATTGEDNPDTIGNIDQRIRRHAAEMLNQLWWDTNRSDERVGTPEYREQNDRRFELYRLEADIRSGGYGGDFYDNLIRAHNYAVGELRRTPLGEEVHPSVRYFVQLADPTVLHYMRLMFFSIAFVVKNMNALNMSVLREYDFWQMLGQEWSVRSDINNPDYIIPRLGD